MDYLTFRFAVLGWSATRRAAIRSSNPSRCAIRSFLTPKDNLIRILAHNFFAPQPVKNASVFVVRQVIHDWPDKECLEILRHLRDAATPHTRLMIIDNLMSYACVEEDLRTIPGAERELPPAPLLPNGGHSSTFAYTEDMLVRLCFPLPLR